MKIIKIVGHPVLIISIFLLLLISGESFGGFYLMYILLGLPHGVPHSIIAIAGLGLMFTGYKVYRQQFHIVKPLLYIFGNALMIFALFIFFQDSKGYNDSTFHQTVPVITFVLFGLCVLCNVLLTVSLCVKTPNKRDKRLKIAS